MSNNNEGQMRLDALNILGLTENQDNEKEIRQAYLLKSRIYHPDKRNRMINNNNNNHEMFYIIKEAYEYLLSKNIMEEYFCVSSDNNGSSVSFNKQNPSLFSNNNNNNNTNENVNNNENNNNTTNDDVADDNNNSTVTFLLCPLCNQPFKKGRPLRAHLQSPKHDLSDSSTPSLANVIKDALQGISIEGKVVSSTEPYSTTATKGLNQKTSTHVAVSIKGVRRLKFHPEKLVVLNSNGKKTNQNNNNQRGNGVSKRRKGEITLHQGKIRAKKKAAAAAATMALRKKKILHPGLTACRDGDFQAVKELLNNGSYNVLDDIDNNGSNGIHWCAGSGYLDILKYLLNWCKIKYDKDDIVHYRDKRSGRNAFHWASRNGRIHICQYLLDEYNMDINSITNDGTSAFHLTAWSGEFDMCKWLVANKCDPHIINIFGCNAIHFACLAGNLNMCKWLYQDLKLDVRLVQLQGHHTLHKAAWAGHKDICEWLQDDIGIDPMSNVMDNKGHTAVSRYLYRETERDSL